jgi:selenocysteine lyase/cysteine desulfurase
VHGLGVEDLTLSELGCDFFAAGTHKWLFGPRGTGFLWGRADAWNIVRPTIPTWEPGVFYSLLGWRERPDIGGGQLMTPGGYHAFDHTWALGSAFDMHLGLGKTRIANRIHELNRQMKEGLRAMTHVRLHTPMDDELSAGIVCFDIEGMPADKVVAALAQKGIIASRTPYRRQHARLCPGLLTPGGDVERTLAAVRAIREG